VKSYYHIIIQLDVFHDYFPLEENHVCTSLQFTPCTSCFQTLRQLRLLFKKTENGFVIVGEKKNLGTDAAPILEPLVDIPEGTKFNFLITETDNNFINITDTDPHLFSDGKKYVFRNTDSQQAVVAGNIATINIHNNSPLNEVVTLAPPLFTAPVVVAENPVKVVLRGSEGEFITEKTVPRDAGNNIVAGGLLLCDTPFVEGIYTLQQVNALNAVTSEKRYFLFEPVTGVRVNGIVQLTYNNIMAAQSKKEIHTTIHLNPRSVFWIYKVDIEKYEDPVEFNLRIKPLNLKVDSVPSIPAVGTPFTKTILFVSANPADWFLNDKVQFRSNNPIPLKKKPYEQLQLVHTAVPQPVIINNLPNPDPLAMEETTPNTYEIEMYLKVK
jgi:hypothetical protein